MLRLPAFKAVIFDMDGLLIDSEPLWRASEQQVFQQVGINLSEQMCHQTTGLSCAEVVEYWRKRYPWRDISNSQIQQQLEQAVIDTIKECGKPLPGVMALLKYLKQQGIRMAVASGSAEKIIQAVISKLNIGDYFDVTHSAEHERQGKPHPDVYLSTLKQMRLNASDCIAFEDSVRGLQAAKAAGLFTVAVPEAINFHQSGFEIADLKLTSLKGFVDRFLNSHTSTSPVA